jgi:hypothetical protein
MDPKKNYTFRYEYEHHLLKYSIILHVAAHQLFASYHE